MKLKQILTIFILLCSMSITFADEFNLTYSDFTTNNVELSGNNIEINQISQVFSSPRRDAPEDNEYNKPIAYKTTYDAAWFLTDSNLRAKFCQEEGYSYSTNYAQTTGYSNLVQWSDSLNRWRSYGTGTYPYYTSITCGSDGYYENGYITKTIPTTKDYYNFELINTITLNGQTITPTLTYQGQKYSFSNNKLTLHTTAGNDITLTYNFTSDQTTTPQLDQNIKLLADTFTIKTNLQPFYNTQSISIDLNASDNSIINFQLGYNLLKLFDFENSIDKDNNNIIIRDNKITLANTFDSGLVASFDLTSDASDYSGNGNDGTAYNGVVFSSEGAEFDGVDDYFNTHYYINQHPSNTISFWIKWDLCDSSYRDFIKSDGWSGNGNFVGYCKDNKIQFDVKDNLGNAKYMTSYPDYNLWHNIVLVQNPRNISLYVDSIFDETEIFNNDIFSASAKLRFSHNTGDLNGTIAKVRIYNRSLSSQEISNLYQKQKKELGLVLDVPLQNTIEDYSTSNNELTLYNGVNITSEGAHFDGVDDYIETSSSLTNEKTIMFSFKVDSLTNQPIISQETGVSNGHWDIQLYNNKLYAEIYTDSWKDAQSNNNILVNTWYDVTLTMGSNGLNMFINGELQTNNDNTALDIINNDVNLRVGRFAWAGFFDGSIKNLKVYNRELDLEEIQIMHNTTNYLESTGTYETTINLSDYEDKSYCAIRGDENTFSTGNIEYFVDGTKRTLGDFFAYNGDDVADISFTLTNGNYEKSPEITTPKMWCGNEPNYQDSQTICENCNSTTLNLDNLVEGGHELEFNVNKSGEIYTYNYDFIIDLTKPVISQLKTIQEGYKFFFNSVFDIDELHKNICTYTAYGQTKACEQYIYFPTNDDYEITVYTQDMAGNFEVQNYNLTINASYEFMELNSFELNVSQLCFNTSTCEYVDKNISFTPENVSYLFDSVGEKNFILSYANETIAKNLTVWVNPKINIYFKNVNNTAITNFELNNVEFQDYATYNFFDLGHGSHNFTFEKFGYETKTVSITFGDSMTTNYSFLMPGAKINISIFDRETKQKITSSISVEMAGNYGKITSTSTGNLIIQDPNILSGIYSFVFSGNDYITEFKTVQFSNQEKLNINVYMIKKNINNSGTIHLTVSDIIGFPIGNQLIKLEEWFATTSVFVSVSELKTNDLGEVEFLNQPQNKLYRLCAVTSNSKQCTDDFVLREVEYKEYLTIEDEVESYKQIEKYNSEFINETEGEDIKFIWDFADLDNIATEGCVKVYSKIGAKKTLLSSKCAQGSSFRIETPLISNPNDYSIMAQAIITDGKYTKTIDEIFMNSIEFERDVLHPNNLDKVLPVIAIVAIIGLGVLSGKLLVLFGSIIPVSWLVVYIIPSFFSATIATFISLICVITMWMLNRRDG